MTRPDRRPTAKGRPAVTRQASYQWLLPQLMDQHGLRATVDLGPLLAERGVVLSDAQVYRLIHYMPERLSLKTLAALCDIFNCTPNDLIVPLVEGAQRTTRAKKGEVRRGGNRAGGAAALLHTGAGRPAANQEAPVTAPETATTTTPGWQPPDRLCIDCGRQAPAQARRTIGGQAAGVCSRCHRRPHGVCTRCGQTGALYGRKQRVPLRCGHCWNANTGTCASCQQTRVLVPTGDGQARTCERCYRPDGRRRGSCHGSTRRIKRRGTDGEPDLCDRCWHGPYQTCMLCRRQMRCAIGRLAGTPTCAICVSHRAQPCGQCGRSEMPYAVLDRLIVCWGCHRGHAGAEPVGYSGPEIRACDLRRPAGWTRAHGCHDCGTDSTRYLYGRCASCAAVAVFDHLTPDHVARKTLAPLRAALLANPQPWASADWLRTNPKLLIGMGTGAIAIEHAALDTLPRTRTTEFIRGQLVATGCLPTRNSYAADFENWLPGFTAKVEPAAHRILLTEYGTWRLLPRIRKPRDRRPQTYSTFQYAKSRVRAAAQFLAWLDHQDVQLVEATQHQVDDFLATHPQLAPTLEPFFRWTSTTHRSRRLNCRRVRRDQPKPTMPADERWQLLRRLLHDKDLELADRVVGALILAYGRPVSAARANKRLRDLGLYPGPGRSRALLHLAARLEAPLLAQALGLHPHTATRWSELAARPYSGYVATATTSTPR